MSYLKTHNEKMIPNGVINSDSLGNYTKPESGIPKSDLSEEVQETLNSVEQKQETLVSGENIRTINNESILGEGNIAVTAQTYVIDNTPEADSNNLVKSSGVAREIVWDVTARNSNATFASLSALLSDANLATLIPTTIRRGGMQIRFVHSNDNKYKQYRLMSDTFNTTIANWQGVDDEPTAGSQNLVESGGVYDSLSPLNQYVDRVHCVCKDFVDESGIDNSGEPTTGSSYFYRTVAIDLLNAVKIKNVTGSPYNFAYYSSSKISSSTYLGSNNTGVVIEGATHVVFVWYEQGHVIPEYITYQVEYENDDIPQRVGTLEESVEDIDERLEDVESELDTLLNGGVLYDTTNYNCSAGVAINTTTQELAKSVDFKSGEQLKLLFEDTDDSVTGTFLLQFRDANFDNSVNINLTAGVSQTYTPLYDIKFLCAYVAGTSVVKNNASVSIKIEYGQVNGIPERVGDLEESVSSNTSNISKNTSDISKLDKQINGTEVDVDLTEWLTSGQINTTTQERATLISIPANTRFTVEVSDSKHALIGTLSLFFKDSTFSSNVGKGTIKYGERKIFQFNQAVAYLACYASSTEVQANGSVLKLLVRNGEGTVIDDISKIEQDIAELRGNWFNKTCLYIGDSISTSDIYFWKGYLEDNYGFKWVRNASEGGSSHETETSDSVLWPADGGITLVPPSTEDTYNTNKSIWYRCANDRMSIYDFDIISICGGTNDIISGNVTLGTTEDTPYLDTTQTRPATLTYAASLMGCVEMLHRDFPTKPILLCTVFALGTYGNTEDEHGVTFSERMAMLQMKIADKYALQGYNITAIPFYWDMRNKVTTEIGVFSKDTVHPNRAWAKRMMNIMAQSVPLK